MKISTVGRTYGLGVAVGVGTGDKLGVGVKVGVGVGVVKIKELTKNTGVRVGVAVEVVSLVGDKSGVTETGVIDGVSVMVGETDSTGD